MAKKKYEPEYIAKKRKDHRKIDTDVAMMDDQRELNARGMADNMMMRGKSARSIQPGAMPKTEVMGQNKPNKVPLKDYSQFGPQNQIRSTGPSNADTDNPTVAPPARSQRNGVWDHYGQGSAFRDDEEAVRRQRGYQDTVGSGPGALGPGASQFFTANQAQSPEELARQRAATTSASNIDRSAIEGSLNEWYQNAMDPALKEDRVARARAGQEAMVRASMGAGEAGRSGAAALLEGEAGRMAEQKARLAELEKEFGIQGLGLTLAGYDLDAERYDEQMQMAVGMAAMTMMEAVEADSAQELLEAMGVDWDKLDPKMQAAMEELVVGYNESKDTDGDGVPDNADSDPVDPEKGEVDPERQAMLAMNEEFKERFSTMPGLAAFNEDFVGDISYLLGSYLMDQGGVDLRTDSDAFYFDSPAYDIPSGLVLTKYSVGDLEANGWALSDESEYFLGSSHWKLTKTININAGEYSQEVTVYVKK